MKSAAFLHVGITLFGCVLKPVLSYNLTFPACAETCTQTVIGELKTCSLTNTTCICTTPALQDAIIACVSTSCTVKERLSGATALMCNAPVRSRSETITAITATSGILAFLATVIRLSVALSQNTFGLDDASAIVAELTGITFTSFVFYLSLIGFGRDTWTVDPNQLYIFQKLTYFGQGIYFWSSGFTKLCFLFFFLRIFPFEETRKLCFAGIVASVLYTLAYSIAAWLQCKPISASWEAWDGEHGEPDYCIDLHIFWFAASGVNIALDLVIAAIPIPQLLKLNLSWKKKFSLVAIFGVGIVTIVVSCIRLPTLKSYGNTNNPLWDHSWGGMVSAVELNVGIICISMPSFRRFFKKFAPKLCASTSEPNSNPYDEEHTPPNRLGSRPKGSRKKKPQLDSDLFHTITKTIDTRIETVREDQDDEIGLVELKKGADDGASTKGSTRSREDMYDVYKSQHQANLPPDW